MLANLCAMYFPEEYDVSVIPILTLLFLAQGHGGHSSSLDRSAERQPSIVASGSTVVLAYGSGDEVRVRISTDSAKTFKEPTTLPSSGKLSLGNHRGPKVAIAGKTILVSAILGEKRRGPRW